MKDNSMPHENNTGSTGPNEHPPFNKRIELYKLITEITNDCLWEWNLATTRIFWIDGGHKRVFGYPIENDYVTQAFWESCIHPDDKSRVLSKLNKTITNAESRLWEDEYRFRKIDGNFSYVCDRARISYDADKKAVRLTGATQDITGRVMLQRKLDAEKINTQKKVTEAILTAHENEKAEVGRKLYDDIGQILAASKMYLQVAVASENNREENINITLQYILKVMNDIQQLAKTLVIPPSHITGLFDNIRNLVTDISSAHSLHISFSVYALDQEQLSESLQTTIFRIVQEQTTNILKHSGATNASIDLSSKDGHVVLLISDNGIGCDTRKRSNGIGLTSIKSRAEINNGSATIWSRPGEGYFLKVKLPLANITA
jgi:PAS domain S-box-containing protein